MREKERAMMMMSSQCLAPNWNLEQERRQEQVQDEQEEAAKSSKSSHVLNHPPSASHLLPMSNYEVAELTWENGRIAMHGLSGLHPSAQTKPIWNWAGDTLESLVHQATHQYQQSNSKAQDHAPAPTSICSTVASSGGKGGENSGQPQTVPTLTRKRSRSESDNCRKNITSCTNNILEECDPSVCGSASATFCRDNDTTMMTWASLESGQSLKNKTFHEDSACHGASENLDNQDEDRDSKVEIDPSNSTKRNRIAAIHNQSERRRRDRINQKMKALQRLVPNASKNDKASMLDEVIEYLKQLQAQIQLMSMRNMPQMVMPLALQQQQQQLQMSMLARMNVGLGPLGLSMGMLNINPMAARMGPPPVAAPPAAASSFVAPAFMMPSLIQAHALASLPQKPDPSPSSTNSSVPLPDPYSTILAQSINMDILNNMAALYRQQISQNNQAMSSQSQQRLGQ